MPRGDIGVSSRRRLTSLVLKNISEVIDLLEYEIENARKETRSYKLRSRFIFVSLCIEIIEPVVLLQTILVLYEIV